jgi:hypothetical protein
MNQYEQYLQENPSMPGPMGDFFNQRYSLAFNESHELDGVLQKYLEAYEAAAARFATDAITDAAARQNYQKNTKRLAEMVLEEVRSGKITAKEGMEFAQQMRNQIMAETRALTSPQALAYAEKLKPTGLTVEYLLDKYAKELFNRPYSALTDAEKSKVYYAVIEAGGRSRPSVNVKTQRLRVAGKVCWLITAALAAYAIGTAENKGKETIRQGALLGGGFGGGALAGLAVSTICGPGAPICAVATVLVGTLAGGLAANILVDTFDEELEEFTRWGIR